jgi:radical SAM protein with 4Fe4S-binding SPASM domain
MNPRLSIALDLARNLTFYRFVNLSKIYTSYYLSRLLRKSIHWGMPVSISVEPTTSCNLSCPECPSGLKKFSRPTGKITRENFNRILEQMHKHLQYITLYFQGEPLLNQEFTEFIRMARRKNIYVATSTNGHFLDEKTAVDLVQSGLNRLIISLDGTDAETYVKYRRGGDFETVIRNIKTMVAAREKAGAKHPFLELQFLVLKHNQHQVEEIKNLGKELGVDSVSLKTAQVYEFEEGNDFIPDLDRYSRYEKQADGKYRIKNKLPNHCFRMWSGCVLTWDSRVVPCCFDKDAEYQFGKLDEQDFKSIWRSKKYDAFRQQILDDRSQIDICRNCTEGM